MAKRTITVTVCDNCGFEHGDTSLFMHVTVTKVQEIGSKSKPAVLMSKDLCIESCVGLPGINRGK